MTDAGRNQFADNVVETEAPPLPTDMDDVFVIIVGD